MPGASGDQQRKKNQRKDFQHWCRRRQFKAPQEEVTLASRPSGKGPVRCGEIRDLQCQQDPEVPPELCRKPFGQPESRGRSNLRTTSRAIIIAWPRSRTVNFRKRFLR